ncbi:MAG TPA: SLBB domain-containing protein [Terriglobia bacterium]|nr:SLBB domain-containing protein [Terriglobia bacterium]
MRLWLTEGFRAAGRASFFKLALLFLLAMAVVCPAAKSQHRLNSRSLDTIPPSDLALENMNYVAASAQEIEAVLRNQPGLLVELKLWMARDATDHGQLVDESGMTTQGIFDRLESDLRFRAVATRILQRYGYLGPEVNPKSELGQRRQLEFLAEQKRLQQPPDSQATPALAQPEPPAYPPNIPRPLRPYRYQQAEPSPPSPQLGPRPATPQNPWNDTNSPPRLQQADRSLPYGRSGANAGLLSGNLDQTREDNSPGRPSYAEGANGLMAAADLPARSATGMDGQPSRTGIEPDWQQRDALLPGSSEVPRMPPGRVSPFYHQPTNGTEPKLLRPPIVHRANPYSDIPSLYDLYEQVSAHSPKLQRFGLEVFENAPPETGDLPMDLPAGPDYVVGPGDGLAISLWGSVAERLYRVVDREGRLAIPEVGPVMVSGDSLSEVQQRVQQVLRTQFRDVSADVSLARLRTVRVYVVGEVRSPGAYDISSLSTPLNALIAAGGPLPEGSLRLVQHFRGKKLVQNVDLYDLLLHGVRTGLERLENGDTILVPPVGPEVTVEGMVRRPAIYELRGEKTLAEVLQLAGGILPTAALRHIEVERVVAHAKRTMLGLDIQHPTGSAAVNQQLESFAVHDGDVIRIFPIAPYNQEAVYLEGHVLRPGRYSYRPGMRLADLISSYSDLLPQPAMGYAEIIRLDPPDDHPVIKSFDLAAALAHPQSSPKLQALDTVRIFGRFDFENPPAVTVGGEVRDPGTYITSGVAHVRDAIYQAGGVTPDALLGSAQLVRSRPDGKLTILSLNLGEALLGDPHENVLLRPRDRILVQRDPLKSDPPSVYVEGDVQRPGRFPLTADLHVSDLVGFAGGLKRSADARTADLTSYNVQGSHPKIGKHQEINLAEALDGKQDAVLHDGDVLTVKELPNWNDIGASITIRGEVRHPGTYGIAPGERLSSVLVRAGGFLPTAYPQAAVLDRGEVRALQQKSRDKLIQEMRQNAGDIKTSLNESASDQAALQQAALQQHKQVLEALQSAPITGRLVIHLSRNLKEFAGSQDDIPVRAGDTLMIPKRPDFVIVTGQVYNSNAITFERGRTAGWYLSRAGGVTGMGNKSAIFIVRANGSVVSTGGNMWWHGDVLSVRVGPGDTIVVPEKPLGRSTLWKNLIQISQIASSSAIAAAVATR